MTGDECAIGALIDQQIAGWNTGDPQSYAAVFTADADYVTFLGAHHRGRDAIAQCYAPLFATLVRGTRLNVEITGLRLLTPDVALIHSRAVVTKHRRRRKPAVRVNTSVAVRTSDGWRLASSQNTTHRPIVQRVMTTMATRSFNAGGTHA